MKDERRRFAHWVLSFVLLAAAAVVVRVGIYLVGSSFPRDPRYVIGCVEGAGIDLALAAIATAPLLAASPNGRSIAFLFSIGSLFLNAAGAHYHAVFQHLPTRSTLAYLADLRALGSSIREHAPIALVALEAVLPAVVCFVAARRFAQRVAELLLNRRRVALAVSLLVTTALASLARASSVEGQEYYGVIGSALHIALPDRGPSDDAPSADGRNLELVLAVKRGLGTDYTGPPADPAYPFCRRARAEVSSPNHASVILLILESVDARSLALSLDGVPVMPHLQRIAADGASFPHFFATGNMSMHALPALFGGVPAVTGHALLMRWPLAHVLGLPRVLRGNGYETAYLHGSDLSFSHQREFLEKIGFERIESCPPEAPRYGWGAPDGVLLDQLRAFVEKRGNGPYFVTAFTVSTHDPYELPPDHPLRFRGNTPFHHFAESLAYLDDELGRFYDWFRNEEERRGTILLLTGDHAPRVPFPGDPTDTTTGEFEYRFQVPLLMVGLNEEATRRARLNAGRVVGGHQDVPATLAALLGVSPPACQQGVNLLAADVPMHRLVPSVAGEALEFLYAHEADRRWMLGLRTGRFKGYDPNGDPNFLHDLASTDPRAHEAKLFLESYLRLMNVLATNDHLAPAAPLPEGVPALPRVTTPLLVLDGSSSQNDVAAMEHAVATGAKWIELNVETTRDHVPIVFRAPAKTPGGDTLTVNTLTLEELRQRPAGDSIPTLAEVVERFGDRIGFFLELEHQATASDLLGLARGTLQALERLPNESHVVIGSADEVLLTTLQPLSRWPLARRLEEESVRTASLDFAHSRRFDWVSIRSDLATQEVVRAAHERQLRVLVYYPLAPADLRALDGERPDGVVTADLRAFDPWSR